MKNCKYLLSSLAIAAAFSAGAATNDFVIKTNKPGAAIQPTMYGIFFEDINFGADGGLYAELIKNRSFEFPQTFMGWNIFGNVQVKDDGPFERNPHYVRLGNPGHGHKHTGIENEGFFGIGVEKDKEYRFSVWARTVDGEKSKIRVEITDPDTMDDRQAIAKQDLEITGKEWKKYTVVLKPSKTDAKAHLRIFLTTPKSGVDLEHVSLFPVDTWNGHENGMRKDLAQKLADLKPGVFRFPGGCIVEGTDMDTRYQWKNTVGPVENRPLNENRWHYTFTNRFYPDYFQTYGLGFYEYFLLSEEIGSEPLPILNVGLVCQYQNNDPHAHAEGEELQQFIDDALDLVEFANGSTDTEWGKLRAEMGHPEPFNLKYIGIGNEQWGPEYPERLQKFLDVMRKQHPEIKIIGSSGPDSEGDKFDYLWPEMRRLKADLVDEHFYRPEKWFLEQGRRYDNYDRKGPKVFAGEYACHGKGKKYNHFNAALLESAFMTGLERNADVVHMATYAPLFAHVEGWQWRPDMIWFDNLESFPTCSYYVQQLYGTNKGDNVLPLTMNGKTVAGDPDQNGLFASAVVDKSANTYIVKVANVSDEPQELNLTFDGMKKATLAGGKAVTLHSDVETAENSLENPGLITPQEKPIDASGNTWSTTIGPKTFAVYTFNIAKK
ncbi:MAG: carbohydrate binding domain-containing protein [Muribaculaceae bacterium]|nr:carbohydrate binding domain-containing protein [Muribaculaceae bacterium]